MSGGGIPGARAIDHVGLTVPDLEEAVAFLTGVLGFRPRFSAGPFDDPEGEWMTRRLGVHPRASARFCLLGLGDGCTLEVFEYRSPEPPGESPPVSAAGAHHIAIHVDDIDAAAASLRDQPSVTVLEGPTPFDEGPCAGLRFLYFRTPWGLTMELISHPPGTPYDQAAVRAAGGGPG